MNLTPKEHILIVDDEEAIRLLLEESLNGQGYQTKAASNASEALAALSTKHFDLVLSDVRMPGMDGLGLLAEIGKKHEDVGVLLLTACEDVSMAVRAMKMGALDYVVKPLRLLEINRTIQKALDRHQKDLDERRYVMHLEEVVKEQTVELRRTFEHMQDSSETALEALVAALDAREHETQAHSKRVMEYTLHLTRVMAMDATLLPDVSRGAMLHDVGKIGVSDNILLKPGRLTEMEWVEMRKHPQTGYWILDGIPGLKVAAEIVLAHQEKYDGTGYPRKLKGEDIPPAARIFAVIDCFDAITSDRPYRKAADYKTAREEIVRCSGTQFDPHVVKHFLKVPVETWTEIRQRTRPEKRTAVSRVN
ncbi:MAG: HD domain-containing phosphohydrolase [Terriglobia bacterium]|jgi:response regulator RpfG family c-di-GMP phosphodiesterase